MQRSSPPCTQRALSECCDHFGEALSVSGAFFMKKSKSILNNSELVRLIGLDAHIMLCHIQNKIFWRGELCKAPKCLLKYSKWKENFPFWGFKRYIKTKRYLLQKGYIYKYKYNGDYYYIRYSKLRELIQEV